MKVWITKWALTAGILEKEVETTHNENAIFFKSENGMSNFVHGEGKNWHRTRSDAEQRADLMRSKKIDSLSQQIKRLEKLTFEE